MSDAQTMTLEQVWARQAELNRAVGIDTKAIGRRLREAEAQGRLDEAEDVRLEAGRALKNYLDAMSAECHELLECLSWKHWYREARQGRQHQLQDVQNARVEATDMLFFWASICQTLGLEVEDVYRLYDKKLGINHQRRLQDRSQAEHGRFESENRDVF